MTNKPASESTPAEVRTSDSGRRYVDIDGVIERKLAKLRSPAPVGEVVAETTHVWIDGPDGPNYHCANCGISKCDDYDCYDTCESWFKERVVRESPIVQPSEPEMPAELELLPCWCRETVRWLRVEPHLDHGEFNCRVRGYYVYCNYCWTRGPVSGTHSKAREGWNKSRSRIPDAQPAKIQHLVQLLKDRGCLAACSFCKGHGDRHVETATYTGQSTCPDCGGTGLQNVNVLYATLSSSLVPDAAKGDAERQTERGCPTCGADLRDCPDCKTPYADGSGYCAICDIFTGPSDEGLRRAGAPQPDPVAEDEVEEEQGRWQDAIREHLIKTCDIPNADSWIDGSGCDSGDPLDVSLTEISQVINHFIDEASSVAAKSPRESHSATCASRDPQSEKPCDCNEVQRLRDLVRYCRHQLLDEGLISQDEFMSLLTTDGPASVGRLEAYDKAIAAARTASPEPSTWLPIESAPKDGTEVLLMVERRAGIRWQMLVGHYMPGGFCIEDHPAIDEGWYFWSGSMFDRASKPTHWQPLPTPPETVTKFGEGEK